MVLLLEYAPAVVAAYPRWCLLLLLLLLLLHCHFRLHNAGIQVILDVVYNHTAEQDDRQPYLLSMR
jgi:hypothetical protein